MDTRYLITGGAGFIGTNLTKKLLEDEKNSVTIIDVNTPKVSGAKWVTLDIARSDIDEFVKDHDVFIHLACQPGVEASVKDPLGTFHQNVYGTLRCLEAARKSGIKRLLNKYCQGQNQVQDWEFLLFPIFF